MKLPKKIMALGLTGLITSLAACNREPTAELTNNTYCHMANIDIQMYDHAGKHTGSKKLLIYDLDGKKDSIGKLTADEVFEIKDGEGVWSYIMLNINGWPISKWKHYLAPDAKKPLVSNNITPMEDIQRADYNAFLCHSMNRKE